MLEAIRCNMDIKFIGSGRAAKAVLFYIMDYITKMQLKTHVTYVALNLTIHKLGEPSRVEDDCRTQAKQLLQKCAYSMLSHQELSGQQVALYLMGYGDHFTSHQYSLFSWVVFEHFLNCINPSPECYVSVICSGHEYIQM